MALLAQPIGGLMGIDGFILVAFILALPANELVIPMLLMGYLAAGALVPLVTSVTVCLLFNSMVHLLVF